MLAGNCGMSPAPSDDSSRAAMYRFLEPCLESLLRTEAFRILPSYLERIACEEAAAAYGGNGGEPAAVRIAVKGFRQSSFFPKRAGYCLRGCFGGSL